jgi:hypothetical protein
MTGRLTMMMRSSREHQAMQMIQIMAAAERGSTGCGDGGCHQQQLAGLDLPQGLALLQQQLLLLVILPVVGSLVDRSKGLMHQQQKQKQQQKQMRQAVQEYLHVA